MQKTNNKREKSCPINNYYKYNWIKLSSQKAQTGRMDGKKKITQFIHCQQETHIRSKNKDGSKSRIERYFSKY